jgi:hypothetical protein
MVGGGGGDGMFVGPIYICNAKTDDIILVSAHHQISTTTLKSNSPLLPNQIREFVCTSQDFSQNPVISFH